jgi:hypothetical protein
LAPSTVMMFGCLPKLFSSRSSALASVLAPGVWHTMRLRANCSSPPDASCARNTSLKPPSASFFTFETRYGPTWIGGCTRTFACSATSCSFEDALSAAAEASFAIFSPHADASRAIELQSMVVAVVFYVRRTRRRRRRV